jgi:hypothetical protein
LLAAVVVDQRALAVVVVVEMAMVEMERETSMEMVPHKVLVDLDQMVIQLMVSMVLHGVMVPV